MFEVGFTELLLIGALALIVLGPERLPKLAQQLGRWAGRARAMARQLREQLDQEVRLQDDKVRRAQTDTGSTAGSPPPDVDDYADPHDTRSHSDAGAPEPESNAANCEQPPQANAPDDPAPAEGAGEPARNP